MNGLAYALRVCACGCGRQFQVTLKRPGTRYIYGHKPRPTSESRPGAAPTGSKGVQTQVRRFLDYRLARKTAEEEICNLERAIEGLDNDLESSRREIATTQAKKDELVARHGRVRKALLHLTAAIDDVDAVDEE